LGDELLCKSPQLPFETDSELVVPHIETQSSRPLVLINLIAGILGASWRASIVLPEAGSPYIRTSRVDGCCFMAFSLLGSDVSVETGLDEQLREQRRRSAVADETPIEVVADRDGP
jgi:hypothetical protein